MADSASATHRRRDALGRVATGAGAGFVGRIVRNSAQFAFAVLAARWLGAEAFGLWLLAVGVTTLAAQAAKVGLDRGAVAVIARHRARGGDDDVRAAVGQALRLALGAGLAVAAILLILSGVLARELFDQPGLLPYLRAMLAGLPFHVLLLVACGATRGFATMRPTVVAEETVQPLALLALFWAFLHAGFAPVSAAWSQSLSVVLAAAVAMGMLWRMVPAAVQRTADRAGLRRALLATSLPLALVAISGRLYAWSSTLILGAWAPGESVAIFQASLRITFVVLFVTMPVNQMLAPVLATTHATGDRDELAGLLRGATRWIVAAGNPLVLSFVMFGADWLQIFGDEFRRGRVVLAVLAVSTLINACAGPAFWLLQMANRERVALAVSVVFLCAQVGLSLALVPGYGTLGAACATLLSVLVSALATMVACRRVLGVMPVDRSILKPLAAAGVAAVAGAVAAVALPAAHGGWSLPRLALGSVVVVLVYTVTLARLRFEDDDLALLDRLPVPGIARMIRAIARQPVG